MTSTAAIPVQRLSRSQEMKRLRRANRLRDRARKIDQLQYRYRHVMTVSTSGFFAITCLVVSHAVGLI